MMTRFAEYCGFCNRPIEEGTYCMIHGDYVTFCSEECLFLFLQQNPVEML